MSLTVAINVSVTPGSGGGGVEQHMQGVVRSLTLASADDIDFLLVVYDDPSWLRPCTDDNMRIVRMDDGGALSDLKQRIGSVTKRTARPILKRTNIHNRFRSDPTVPDANGRFAEMGADVVHFPSLPFYRTELPTIFTIHDLQHRHYPQFFRERSLKERHLMYPVGCREADAVITPSQFVKDDIVDEYDVPADRIHVIRRGPPTELYDDVTDETIRTTAAEYDLPDRFALYPAQTMEHKNHTTLVRAIGRLKDEGTRVNLVLTGKRSNYWPNVREAITEAGVEGQVRMLGFIPGAHLRALYRLADFVVFPSLFEGGGFPLIEAWAEETPVACSNTTALGERAGDAALTFDPESVAEVAAAIQRIHTDPELRTRLADRGANRVADFSWEQTGAAYRDLYCAVADGRAIGNRDTVETTS